MTDLVTYVLTDGVAVITMDDGKANAMSLALQQAIHAALDQAERDAAPVVLAGRPGILSAGFDLKTLAASGIKGFGKLLDHAAESSALKRNVSIEEVGNVATFLCSDLASGVTGEVTYVDAGYNFYEKGPDL